VGPLQCWKAEKLEGLKAGGSKAGMANYQAFPLFSFSAFQLSF
jgi:hypothetical protein